MNKKVDSKFFSAFKPKARLLRTLGSELISSDIVAFVELVKNSYDADADAVVIDLFITKENNIEKIRITDNGSGMDQETIESAWFDIATDYRKISKKSSKGRRVQGEKGIGRFAASRLGNEFYLTTKTVNSEEIYMLVDWRKFDEEDIFLEDIEIGWESREIPTTFSDNTELTNIFSQVGLYLDTTHGTCIEIEGINHDWTVGDVEELRIALSRLVRPSVRGSEEKFRLFLNLKGKLIDNSGKKLGPLSWEIEPPIELSSPHYSLQGSISNDGQLIATYEQFLNEEEKKTILEENYYATAVNDEVIDDLGEISFEFKVWDRGSEVLKNDPNIRNVSDFRKILNDICGISIYRDGFRVFPYGEAGNDWLGLDSRRVQNPSLRISNNQVYGSIFITNDHNEGLKDQSNREGLIKNKAYAHLQLVILKLLSEIEKRKFNSKRAKDLNKNDLATENAFKNAKESIKAGKPSKEIIANIEILKEKYDDTFQEYRKTLYSFHRSGTLGSILNNVSHDLTQLVSPIFLYSDRGKILLNREELKKLDVFFEQIKPIEEYFDHIIGATRTIEDKLKFLNSLGLPNKGRPKEHILMDVVNKVHDLYRLDLATEGIKWSTSIDPNLKVRVHESDLVFMLINLVTNSIYWIKNSKDLAHREIRISAKNINDRSINISVNDSGPGVPEEIADKIFLLNYSSKPDGMGLGLSIVNDLVSSYKGSVELVDEGILGGANFVLTLNRGVLS